MTDFSEFQPGEWIEEGTFLVPLPSRTSSRVKTLVRDSLFGTATATALALCVAAGWTSAPVAIEARTAFAIATHRLQHFASPSGKDDVDPHLWGDVIGRLRRMKTVVEATDDVEDPEPFI